MTTPEKMTIAVTEHPSGMLLFETAFHGIPVCGVARDVGDMVARIQAHRKVIKQMVSPEDVPEGWSPFDGGLESGVEGTDTCGHPVQFGVALIRRDEHVRVGITGGPAVVISDEALRYVLDLEPVE